AEFGADAAIDAWCRRPKAQQICPAGNCVELATKRRYPEGMDHIGTGEDELDGGAGGQVNLVGGVDPGAILGFVRKAPPILFGSNVDAHIRWILFTPAWQQRKPDQQQDREPDCRESHAAYENETI